MSRQIDLILKGGTVVNQDGTGIRDIAIDKGRIVAVGDVSGLVAAEVRDCRKLHILPGVIDSQVHFREPGNEHKEDLETGSLAAILGGVTGVFLGVPVMALLVVCLRHWRDLQTERGVLEPPPPYNTDEHELVPSLIEKP